MTKIVLTVVMALAALVMVSESAFAHQPCGWKRVHGQRVWLCQQQPRAHYYQRQPQRYRQPVIIVAPAYPLARSYSVPTQPQQTGWQPSVDCNKVGGKRVINPNTGIPSCYVP